MDIEAVAELLEILDFIDKKLGAYKKKYLKLKQKTLRELQKRKEQMEAEDPQEDKKKKKKKKKKEERKEEKAVDGNTDLLDLGGDSDPQTRQAEDEEEKTGDKKGGLKRLQAPPSSKSHVLSGMARLKAKLEQENGIGRHANSNVMDMLIDLDIKSEPQKTETPGGGLSMGVEDLLFMGTPQQKGAQGSKEGQEMLEPG